MHIQFMFATVKSFSFIKATSGSEQFPTCDIRSKPSVGNCRKELAVLEQFLHNIQLTKIGYKMIVRMLPKKGQKSIIDALKCRSFQVDYSGQYISLLAMFCNRQKHKKCIYSICDRRFATTNNIVPLYIGLHHALKHLKLRGGTVILDTPSVPHSFNNVSNLGHAESASFYAHTSFSAKNSLRSCSRCIAASVSSSIPVEESAAWICIETLLRSPWFLPR